MLNRAFNKEWAGLGLGLDKDRMLQIQAKANRMFSLVLACLSAVSIIILILLWFNHISFPLNLELMEGNILQHFQRALAGQPIFPEPSPEYVALAYNPLYYYLAVPFAWVFGDTLFTLRLVAILGIIGSGWVLYRVVLDRTGVRWWALVAVGLFAAAYRVMDAYLDSAHSDSWMLFSVLLGSYLIDRKRSFGWNLTGVLILVAGFWFKQHGALFVAGGVAYLTWRDGFKPAVPYWAAAGLLGPVLYLFAGPHLFGSQFHYFTWSVPRRWTVFTAQTTARYLEFILKSYPILALAAAFTTLYTLARKRDGLNIWHFQLPLALLSGLMGALDRGSSNNVFIPMGIWFILLGTVGLYELTRRVEWIQRYSVHLVALLLSFGLFAYNPLHYITPTAIASYAEFIDTLNHLDGPVYAPQLGQLEGGYTLTPAVSWVALEDMVRAPGVNTQNHPTSRRLLDRVVNPAGMAYIVTNTRLETDSLLGFMAQYYRLEADWGDRFKPLSALPHRWDVMWPRYLYRYAPEEARRQPEVLLASR